MQILFIFFYIFCSLFFTLPCYLTFFFYQSCFFFCCVDSLHLFYDLFSPVLLTFLVFCLLQFLCFLWFSYQSCLLLSFGADSLHIFYHSFFHIDIFVDIFVTFFNFLGFSIKGASFTFSVDSLNLIYDLFSPVFLTFFMLCLLRFSHFYGFLIKVVCFYLFVSILLSSFTIISSLVINMC